MMKYSIVEMEAGREPQTLEMKTDETDPYIILSNYLYELEERKFLRRIFSTFRFQTGEAFVLEFDALLCEYKLTNSDVK